MVEDLAEAPDGFRVTIRQSKTDQEGAGEVIAIPRGASIRPVEAVQTWLEAADITSGPVFRSIGKGGAVTAAPLSAGSVADIVKAYAALVPPSEIVDARDDMPKLVKLAMREAAGPKDCTICDNAVAMTVTSRYSMKNVAATVPGRTWRMNGSKASRTCFHSAIGFGR